VLKYRISLPAARKSTRLLQAGFVVGVALFTRRDLASCLFAVGGEARRAGCSTPDEDGLGWTSCASGQKQNAAWTVCVLLEPARDRDDRLGAFHMRWEECCYWRACDQLCWLWPGRKSMHKKQTSKKSSKKYLENQREREKLPGLSFLPLGWLLVISD